MPMIALMPTVTYLILATPDQMVRLFPDDAFYYLQSAAASATAGIATFDGINATNGFHPLQFATLLMASLIGGKGCLLVFGLPTLWSC